MSGKHVYLIFIFIIIGIARLFAEMRVLASCMTFILPSWVNVTTARV